MTLFAQPKGLRHPLKEPVFISGSFGEYRSFSRFHMGLDYKTFLQSGVPVYTPMAGVVRLVHVSELYGYGNALFLRSPLGYDLTFAHLRDFSCPEKQKESSNESSNESSLELFRQALRVLVEDRPLRLRIPPYFRFRKDDCIAATGESGSGPPHLHFEFVKNRVFLDPLSQFGMEIRDHEPPVLLTLFIESKHGVFRFPLKREYRQARQKKQKSASNQSLLGERGNKKGAVAYYALAKKLPYFSRQEPLRFMLGLYDHMASRNRNGIYRFSLSIEGQKVYERRLAKLRIGELSSASQVYHTAFTQIGREYVYLFAPASRPFYRPKDYLLRKIKKQNLSARIHADPRSGAERLSLHFYAFDASGNRSELQFLLPLARRQAEPPPPGQGAGRRFRSEVPFRGIHARARLELRARSLGSQMRLRFQPGSVQLKGKVRLFTLPQLSLLKEAEEKLHLPIGPKGELRVAFEKEAGDPVFYVDGTDLYFWRGALGYAFFQSSGTGKDGLYYYSYAKKFWRILAHPYLIKNGKNYYRFRLNFTGPIAQLRDIAPPIQTAAFLWKKPNIFIKKNRAIVREYSVREYGSGIYLPGCQVLLDGRPIPFRWGKDRSVIQVELPASLLAPNGSLLSLQIRDQAGNVSPWYFEWILPSFKKGER